MSKINYKIARALGYRAWSEDRGGCTHIVAAVDHDAVLRESILEHSKQTP